MADLAPISTATGLLQVLMLHESLSPINRDWDVGKALRSMRLMRPVVENRTHHPKLFGVRTVPAGASVEMLIMKVRTQFAAFADAPNFPERFIKPVHDTVALSRTAGDPRAAPCLAQIDNAILASTEPRPPADCVKPDLYYWRTAAHGGPGPHCHPFETIQGNTFYTQDDIR